MEELEVERENKRDRERDRRIDLLKGIMKETKRGGGALERCIANSDKKI